APYQSVSEPRFYPVLDLAQSLTENLKGKTFIEFPELLVVTKAKLSSLTILDSEKACQIIEMNRERLKEERQMIRRQQLMDEDADDVLIVPSERQQLLTEVGSLLSLDLQ